MQNMQNNMLYNNVKQYAQIICITCIKCDWKQNIQNNVRNNMQNMQRNLSKIRKICKENM
jgi:hypothetical protein